MPPTAIPYATMGWSVVTGCTPVGAGCEHCWARSQAKFRPLTHAGWTGLTPIPFSRVVPHPLRLREPLKWRQSQVVFVASRGDLFHPDVPDWYRDDVFDAMRQVEDRGHIWLVMTKRVEEARRYFDSTNARTPYLEDPGLWLMVSAWDQESADRNIPILMQIPTLHRGVSIEPMLGEVTLIPWLGSMPGTHLDWVIVGCESGPGRRPIVWEWAEVLRTQCAAARVPMYLKQWTYPLSVRPNRVIRFEPQRHEVPPAIWAILGG